MGSNFTDYIYEAHRCLKLDGTLWIAEATSRFKDLDGFINGLEKLGFDIFKPKKEGILSLLELLKVIECLSKFNCNFVKEINMGISELLNEEAKKGRFTCPYCGVFGLFYFSELQRIDLIEERNAKCPSCSQVIIQARKLDPSLQCTRLGKFDYLKSLENWETIYPKRKEICTDKRIPEEIRKILNEAFSIIEISPDSVATLSRRALERILKKYLGLRAKNLEELIKKSKDILHNRIFRLLDAVRGFGNFGAHLKEDSVDSECIFVEYDEASAVLEAVKALAIDRFVNMDDSEQILKKLEDKKKRIKK